MSSWTLHPRTKAEKDVMAESKQTKDDLLSTLARLKKQCVRSNELIADLKGKLEISEQKKVELMEQAKNAESVVVDLMEERGVLQDRIAVLAKQLNLTDHPCPEDSRSFPLNTPGAEGNVVIDTHLLTLYFTWTAWYIY